MINLYHYPMACSTACRFVAAEAGIEIELQKVDINTKKIDGGGSLFDINPLGQVSTLVFPDGRVLTENTAIMMWLQSLASDGAFKRSYDDADYYKLLSWLGFCGTELHKSLVWQLVRSDTSHDAKDMARSLAPARLSHINTVLDKHSTLLSSGFSAADCYLLWCGLLLKFTGVDLNPYPNVLAAMEATSARPAIAPVLAEDAAEAMRLGGGGIIGAVQF